MHFSPVVSDSTIPARARELTALVAAGELQGRGEEIRRRKGEERRGKRRKGEEKKEEGGWKD